MLHFFLSTFSNFKLNQKIPIQSKINLTLKFAFKLNSCKELFYRNINKKRNFEELSSNNMI